MDIDLIRRQTKGCSNKIFLNSAGSSMVPDEVTAIMVDYLNEEAITGGYALAAKREAEIDQFYTEAAILLNCSPDNIAYTTSATDSYARALTAIDFKNGDVILTTDDDYVSNQLAFLSLKHRYGVQVIRANNLPDGDLDLDSFEKLVKQHHPKLVALTHIPTNSGLIQPAEQVGKICRQYDILYLLDACQSVGQMNVDVKKTGCDFLTTTGRKFLRGPRGTGLLYISDRVLATDMVPLIFDMRGSSWTGPDTYELFGTSKRFELWESSYAGKLGFAVALKYLNAVGITDIEQYNTELMKQFRTKLEQVKGLKLHDRGSRLSSILTFTTENRSLEQTAQLLRDNGVYFSTSPRTAAVIDFGKKNLDAVLRFSPHYFNTVEELEKVVTILAD
ncbi:MAG TPA: aminotransferase class V-fold PLP-dependent enzyme [Pedobacter sp.]